MSQPSTPPRSIDLEEFERRLREPQQANSESDPLSELARLVGHTGRDPFAPATYEPDPYAQPQPAPRAPAAPPRFSAPPPQNFAPAPPQQRSAPQPYSIDPRSAPRPASAPQPSAPPIAPAAPQNYPPVQNYAPAQSYAPAQNYAQPDVPPLPDFLRQSAAQNYQAAPQSYPASYAPAPAYGAHQGGAYAGFQDAAEQGGAYYEQSEGPWMPQDQYAPAPAHFGYTEPRSHRKLYLIGGTLAVILVGIGLAFTMRSFSGPKEAPVISALQSPTKIQPETSDNSNDDPSASVLDRGRATDAQTKVVNREEQPVDLGQAPLRPKAPPASNGFPEPKKVRTVSVRPDGTIIDDPSAPSLPPPTPLRPSTPPKNDAPTLPNKTASAPASAPAVDPKAATPKNTQRTPTTPSAPTPTSGDPKPKSIAQVLANSTASTEAAVASAKTPPAPAATGSFAVQFSASPSESEANAALARVKDRYGSVLGSYRANVTKGDSNGRTVYRVRVNGLDRPKAVDICENIRAAGGTCFVAGN